MPAVLTWRVRLPDTQRLVGGAGHQELADQREVVHLPTQDRKQSAA